MAAIAGINGSVLIGSTAVGQIGEWTLDVQAALHETSHFGDTWKEYVAGLREWTGKFSGRLDMSDAEQLAVYNALLGGTTVSLVLQTTTGHSYTGTAFVKQMSAKAPISGTEDVDYSITGSGALSYS